MPDTYGALQIPAQVTPGGATPTVQTGGDPLLGYTADFIKAVLTASVTTAWQQVAPGKPAVQKIVLANPTDLAFVETELPALFVFREDPIADQSIEWFACDYRYNVSTVHAWWVMPTATQTTRGIRYGMMNALVKTIDAAIENGRDPSYVVPGDADAQAATMGSILSRFAGWDVFALRRGRRRTLVIKTDTDPRTYEMLALEFHCEELLQRDITTAPADTGNTVAIKIPDQGTGLGPLTVGNTTLT